MQTNPSSRPGIESLQIPPMRNALPRYPANNPTSQQHSYNYAKNFDFNNTTTKQEPHQGSFYGHQNIALTLTSLFDIMVSKIRITNFIHLVTS